MTPFEEAGYTDSTKFKVLVDYKELMVGDIVTLYADNGGNSPWFKTVDGRRGYMYLPGMDFDGVPEELEVYNPVDNTESKTIDTQYDIELIKTKLNEIRELVEFIEISIGEGK